MFKVILLSRGNFLHGHFILLHRLASSLDWLESARRFQFLPSMSNFKHTFLRSERNVWNKCKECFLCLFYKNRVPQINLLVLVSTVALVMTLPAPFGSPCSSNSNPSLHCSLFLKCKSQSTM